MLLMDVSDDEMLGYVDLGLTQNNLFDWQNSIVYSMFDGSWPTVDGQLVPLYDQTVTEHTQRSLVPVKLNGDYTYLVVVFRDGSTEGSIIGANAGYDEGGFPIRETTKLKDGDIIIPVYTLYGQPYSPVYLKTVHTQLSTIFNHACKFYGLRENPASKVGNMGKAKNREMLIWTREEYEKFSFAVMDKPLSFYAFEMLPAMHGAGDRGAGKSEGLSGAQGAAGSSAGVTEAHRGRRWRSGRITGNHTADQHDDEWDEGGAKRRLARANQRCRRA